MDKDKLNEAAAPEVEAQLSQLQAAHDLRKAEMEDDELWSAMGRGAKMSYIAKLKAQEDKIERLKNRLARLKMEPAVVEEEGGKMEDYIEGQKDPECDIESEVIASTETPGQSEKDIAQKAVQLRRSMEGIINNIEDLVLNNDNLEPHTISGITEILAKFKEIKDALEHAPVVVEPAVITITDDIEPETAPEPPREDDRYLLKGKYDELKEFDNGVEVEFSGDAIAKVVRTRFKVEDEENGMMVISVPNAYQSSKLSEPSYKIIIYYGDNRLGVYSEYNDEDGNRTAEKVEKEILSLLHDKSTNGMRTTIGDNGAYMQN
jgi:hypothetical protein